MALREKFDLSHFFLQITGNTSHVDHHWLVCRESCGRAKDKRTWMIQKDLLFLFVLFQAQRTTQYEISIFDDAHKKKTIKRTEIVSPLAVIKLKLELQ